MSRGTAAAGHFLHPLGSRRSICRNVPTCELKLEDDVGNREGCWSRIGPQLPWPSLHRNSHRDEHPPPTECWLRVLEAVRYSGHPGTAPATAPAKVLMSWSMTNNLMLGASPTRALPVTQPFKRLHFRIHMYPRALRGSAGIVWEAMGLWLVASLSETRLRRSLLEGKRLVQPNPCSSGRPRVPTGRAGRGRPGLPWPRHSGPGNAAPRILEQRRCIQDPRARCTSGPPLC